MGTGHAGNVNGRHGGVAVVENADFNFFVVKLVFPQQFAELLSGFLSGIDADQCFQHAFFGGNFSFGGNAFAHFFLGGVQRIFQQIADDGFNVTANIADFSKFGSFHFDKRRFGQFGQAAGNFGFADPGGANH